MLVPGVCVRSLPVQVRAVFDRNPDRNSVADVRRRVVGGAFTKGFGRDKLVPTLYGE